MKVKDVTIEKDISFLKTAIIEMNTQIKYLQIKDLQNKLTQLEQDKISKSDLIKINVQENQIQELKKQVEELKKRAAPRYFFNSEQITNFNNNGINLVPSSTLVTVPQYQVSLEVPFNLQFLQVTFHIPFVGNSENATRNRIILKFDNIYVSDATKYVNTYWELHEITLTGLVPNVQQGSHSISIWVHTDKGQIQIPHYNISCSENTINPKLFANYYYFGIEI